jgi:sigma-B regulation protein RsbU (phosphoserine phosphatase)
MIGVVLPMDVRLADSTNLRILSRVVADLNQAVDVRGCLSRVLANLLETIGLETGWIILRPAPEQETWGPHGTVLAASHNVPRELELDCPDLAARPCRCENRWRDDPLTAPCNENACPRVEALGPLDGKPRVHGSAPLFVDGRVLGVLNAAHADWRPLSRRSLNVLKEAGRQIGAAVARARVHERLLTRRSAEQAALLELSERLLEQTEPDAVMAALMDAVVKLLNVDACALLLPTADGRHLRFRASAGWRVDPADLGREVPADGGCCAWVAMEKRTPVVIADLEDTAYRAARAPWMAPEGFRGHMAVPLVAKDRPLGSLIVDQREPRRFSEAEVRSLRLMAHYAALALETAQLRADEQAHRQVDAEMAVAQEMQASLLPEPRLVLPGWEIDSVYRAARQVGGDFYDFLKLPRRESTLGLVIGDVAGKSVSGALLMALSLTAIRDAVLRKDGPAAVLEAANERLRREIREDRFVSAFFGALDVRTGVLEFANAGQNPPFVLRAAGGDLEELPTRGLVLGIRDELDVEEGRTRIEPGDALLLFTDGVTEAMNGQRSLFGEERLRAALTAERKPGANALLHSLVERIDGFAGEGARSDDLTMVAVQRLPAGT